MKSAHLRRAIQLHAVTKGNNYHNMSVTFNDLKAIANLIEAQENWEADQREVEKEITSARRAPSEQNLRQQRTTR